MKRFPALLRVMVMASVVVLAAGCADGQTAATTSAKTDDLYKTVESLDTQLFDAYNHCELEKLGALVADDLEFYHDVTGLSLGRKALVDAIKENICGKVTRELVAGSLEVYPIAKYGAVEMGSHTFHHPGEPNNVGEAKFVMLWKNDNGQWKLTRVLSFDHHPLKQ
jgi:hypothetical protein